MQQPTEDELRKALGLENYHAPDVLNDIVCMDDETFLAFAYQVIVWGQWRDDAEMNEVAAGVVAEIKRRNLTSSDALEYVQTYETKAPCAIEFETSS